jgi:predicted protein tyrosine phosphatase
MRKKVLFVCSANVDRSPTAEKIYRREPSLNVRSAGTLSYARVPVSAELIEWADCVCVMQPSHLRSIGENFPEASRGKELVCLDVPDVHRYMSAALVSAIREKMDPLIARWRDGEAGDPPGASGDGAGPKNGGGPPPGGAAA